MPFDPFDLPTGMFSLSLHGKNKKDSVQKGMKLLLFVLLHACNSAFAVGQSEPQVIPRPIDMHSAPANPSPIQADPEDDFVLPPVADTVQALSSTDIRGFHFEGNTVFSADELQTLVAPYIGRRLTAANLEDIRNLITVHYVNNGYISSGALIAALADYPGNVVPIRVVEGHIDGFIIKGEERLNKRYIEERLVHGNEVLNMNVIRDRFRLLLTDPLFVKLNSRIIPGTEPGKALLDIDVARALPYSLGTFRNNYLPPSIGAEANGLAGWLRNLTGHGDVLDMTVQRSKGADPVHLGWSVPLDAGGTRIHASLDRGTSTVIEEPLRPINIENRTSGFEFGLSHSLVDALARKIDIGLSYGERESKSTLLGLPFSFTPGEQNGFSRTRAWRFSQDWTERWEKRALSVRSVFSFGRNNADPTGSAVPVANRNFLVWTGQIQLVQRILDNGTQLLLRGVTQNTSDQLLPLDRISLGGVGTVRGYRENTLVRDQGYAASAELGYPLLPGEDSKRSLNLVAFLDAGNGWNKHETHQRLSSAGAGLNWRYYGISTDLYLARKTTKLPVRTQGNMQDRGIHFQVSYSFF